MRILQIHNFYQQPGGEDRVLAEEATLLRRFGHTVEAFTVHNDAVDEMNRFVLAASSFWNFYQYRTLRERVQEVQPDVAHVHNTLPLISPAAYYALHREGVPVVQTLHNYRLYCPGAFFAREGRVCEDCLARTFAWPGVVHACYRDSRSATAVVAGMLTAHRLAGTWTRRVNRYIALTEFARTKFIEAGLPAECIDVKPNFAYAPATAGSGEGGYALFVGRLSPEKGVGTLLDAWAEHSPGLPLRIVGDGPMGHRVSESARGSASVEWLGRCSPEEVYELMAAACVLVVPSEWYETFGRVVIEAFSVGTPVVASRIGALAELVEEGLTGRLFKPGDAGDLAAQIRWIGDHPDVVDRMRARARRVYEQRFTPERNYGLLLDIYERALRRTALGGGK